MYRPTLWSPCRALMANFMLALLYRNLKSMLSVAKLYSLNFEVIQCCWEEELPTRLN
jgi:hypothetical protein